MWTVSYTHLHRDGIIHNMIDEQFIVEMDNGHYAITNMGALLFAKNINDFSRLKRKAIRVIQYKGCLLYTSRCV